MNVFKPILLMWGAIFAFAAASCISDEFTDSPSVTLSFSTDTVDFGTVFTDLTTPTARLVVRNNNKKGVTISSIGFADPDSPFSMNVDGVSGESFRDVEIRGNDSIYIFLECYVAETAGDEPWTVADRLQFVTNGVPQEVDVEATAMNVTRLRDVTVESDTRFTAARPYVVFGELTVAEGATLTVEPGARLLFHDGAGMRVEGTLNAVGSTGQFIDMRGDRLDDILPDTPYDIMAGQWRGVTFAKGSFGNRMEFVDMRSTSEGLRVDSCGDLSRTKLTIVNSWLHNSQSTVLESKYAKVDAYGCCFSEAADAVVELWGGEHEFVQCTVANNYLFSAVTGANLTLRHCLPEDAGENGNPLMSAAYENCIIWGLGTPINTGDLTGSAVYLRNVLLKAEGKDDANFVDCVWDEDPLFLTVRADYYFNYHVEEGSPAIGRGDREYVLPICRYDMDGADRLTGAGPTLGAYQSFVSP